MYDGMKRLQIQQLREAGLKELAEEGVDPETIFSEASLDLRYQDIFWHVQSDGHYLN